MGKSIQSEFEITAHSGAKHCHDLLVSLRTLGKSKTSLRLLRLPEPASLFLLSSGYKNAEDLLDGCEESEHLAMKRLEQIIASLGGVGSYNHVAFQRGLMAAYISKVFDFVLGFPECTFLEL